MHLEAMPVPRGGAVAGVVGGVSVPGDRKMVGTDQLGEIKEGLTLGGSSEGLGRRFELSEVGQGDPGWRHEFNVAGGVSSQRLNRAHPDVIDDLATMQIFSI